MHWHRRVIQSARQLCRLAFSWRSARVFCAVWFALTSVGFPLSLSQLGRASCATNPGQQCRCSLTKRMSGTCCCSRGSKPQATKSCCAAKQTASRVAPPEAACCSSKSTGPTVAATPQKVELSIARCDCGSDSPQGVSQSQEPRLPVMATVISVPEPNIAFVAFPDDRVESALLLPPVPPPKVVL